MFARNFLQLLAVENPKNFLRLANKLGKLEQRKGDAESALYELRNCVGENRNCLQVLNRLLTKERQLVPLRRKILKKIVKKTVRNLQGNQNLQSEQVRQLIHFLFQISVSSLDSRSFFSLADFQKIIIKKMRKRIQDQPFKEKVFPLF